MDSLRLILIALGVLLLAGLYVWDRMQQRRRRGRGKTWAGPGGADKALGPPSAARPNEDEEWVGTPRVVRGALSTGEQKELEALGDMISERVQRPVPASAPARARRTQRAERPAAATAGRQDGPPAEAEQVYALHVLAVEGEQFAGTDLGGELDAAGLVFGPMDIFHFPAAEGDGAPVMFSLANMLEPGTFDSQRMAELTTPGLLLFMTLPNAARPSVAYDTMLATARRLADALAGTVRDERRCVLTAQAIERARERIHAYESRQGRVKSGR